jgi:cysteine-rich repeat protein
MKKMVLLGMVFLSLLCFISFAADNLVTGQCVGNDDPRCIKTCETDEDCYEGQICNICTNKCVDEENNDFDNDGIPNYDSTICTSECKDNFSCSPKQDNNFRFEMLSKTDNCNGTFTYRFKIKNDNCYALSYAAIGLPSGAVPIWPSDDSVYYGEFKNYIVENPADSPFYSIRYDAIGEGIKKGGYDIFEFVLDEDPGDYPIKIKAKAGFRTGYVTLYCYGSNCSENCEENCTEVAGDNCICDYNPDQHDSDDDGIGDVCDPQTCGNGLLEEGEECDDGNNEDGDGCSATCQIEEDPCADNIPPILNFINPKTGFQITNPLVIDWSWSDPDNQPDPSMVYLFYSIDEGISWNLIASVPADSGSPTNEYGQYSWDTSFLFEIQPESILLLGIIYDGCDVGLGDTGGAASKAEEKDPTDPYDIVSGGKIVPEFTTFAGIVLVLVIVVLVWLLNKKR